MKDFLPAYVDDATTPRGTANHDLPEDFVWTRGHIKSTDADSPGETLRLNLVIPVEVACISAATSRKMAKGRGPMRSM